MSDDDERDAFSWFGGFADESTAEPSPRPESEPFEKKWNALYSQPDPPEYLQPARPDQAFKNGTGQISVRSFLHDPYQVKLIESDWLERLVAEIGAYPELCNKTLIANLRPTFNKAILDSGIGYPVGSKDDQRNHHKNRFVLRVDWALPASSPMDVSYEYEIMYNPGSQKYPFQLLSMMASYLWRGHGDSEDLEQRLLDSGILREVVVDPAQPPRELASISMEGTCERPEFVVVEKRRHVLSVAIGDPRSFPSDLAAWQKSSCIVEPVLVRDRQILEAFRQNLYSGLELTKAVSFKGFELAKESSFEELDKRQSAKVRTALRSEDHFHIHYFNAWGAGLDVWVSRSRIFVSGGLSSGSLHAVPAPAVWETLEKLAMDERIWLPDPDRCGMDGWTWTLERTGQEAKRVSLFCPHSCPLVEFCFDLMRLVGLEPEIKRHVSWHEPGQGW